MISGRPFLLQKLQFAAKEHKELILKTAFGRKRAQGNKRRTDS